MSEKYIPHCSHSHINGTYFFVAFRSKQIKTHARHEETLDNDEERKNDSSAVSSELSRRKFLAAFDLKPPPPLAEPFFYIFQSSDL